VKCPHCGGRLESTQQRWQRKMRAQGRCTGCGNKLTEADLVASGGAPFARPPARCFRCRRGAAARAKARYDAASLSADKAEGPGDRGGPVRDRADTDGERAPAARAASPAAGL